MVHFVIWKTSTCFKLFKYTFKPIGSEISLFVYYLSAVYLLFVSCLFTFTYQMVHFVICNISTCLKLFKYTFKPVRTKFFGVCLQFVSCLLTFLSANVERHHLDNHALNFWWLHDIIDNCLVGENMIVEFLFFENCNNIARGFGP